MSGPYTFIGATTRIEPLFDCLAFAGEAPFVWEAIAAGGGGWSSRSGSPCASRARHGLARGRNRAQLHSGADASCTTRGLSTGCWCFLLGVTLLAGCGGQRRRRQLRRDERGPTGRNAAWRDVDFRIGGDIAAGEEYQFADVRGLALLPDDRFVVSDYMAQRVGLYASGGRFYHRDRRGWGRPWRVRPALDGRRGSGRFGVDLQSFAWSRRLSGLHTGAAGASYLGFLSPDRRLEEQRRCLSSRKPLFAADGLIGPHGL